MDCRTCGNGNGTCSWRMDFILKDGTILFKDETPNSGTVAAVIVRAAADGKPVWHKLVLVLLSELFLQ